jgi:CheY-like chemotaxis protein
MKKVLLIEDDPFMVDIYSKKLREASFEFDVAEDGREALKKIEQMPDLILLDIILPGIDGWEILEKVKGDPQLKSIPVFVLSNLGQKSEVEKALKLGADKYLIKANFTPSQVVEEIKRWLKK